MQLEQVFPFLFDEFNTGIVPDMIQILIYFSPVILAGLLFVIFWPLWLQYVRAAANLANKRVLLEIRLPKEMMKSPLAMELFLTSFHNTADGNFYAQYWEGQTRPWFSLEMVSLEGQVKMFIWTPEKSRAFIESSLYAQFPGIEVTHKADYAQAVQFDPKTMKMWANEFKFTKNDAYPIKTYVDYGLDKDPKEEFKVDPLSPLLEFLGSIGPNQQVWIQIMIRSHKDDQPKPGFIFKTTDSWKDSAQKIINEILIRDPKTKVSGKPKEGQKGPADVPFITKGETEVVNAIERSLTKQAFDCGIRAIYISKKDFFNPSNIGGIIGSLKQFSSESLNGFKPGSAWLPNIEFPWQDYRDIRKNRSMKLALTAYKMRSYFYPPFTGKIMVMNTEELATLFHFPGEVAGTPTLERIPSKKSEAPVNLPT